MQLITVSDDMQTLCPLQQLLYYTTQWGDNICSGSFHIWYASSLISYNIHLYIALWVIISLSTNFISTDVMFSEVVSFLRQFVAVRQKHNDGILATKTHLVWLEVLTVVSMTMAVFWFVVQGDRPDDGGSTDLWNFGKHILVYTALQPRRQPPSKTHLVCQLNNQEQN
jgi:hypothetical protein